MSGGSISEPDLPPVLPAPELSGKLAAGAIIVAAHRSGDAKAALEAALEFGEGIAARGVDAQAR
jgi:hypothetical protein